MLVWVSTRDPIQSRVRHFHRLFEGVVRDTPHEPTWQQLLHRDDLIMEEFEELHHELGRAMPDLPKIAHEAADLYITLLGLAVELGFDLDEVAHCVMDANMTKTSAGPNRKPTKGQDFRPADVEAVLNPPSVRWAKPQVGNRSDLGV